MNRYWTLEEAARYLKIDESELLAKIEKGAIAGFSRKGSNWVIWQDTLYELKHYILSSHSPDWKSYYEKLAESYALPTEIDGWIIRGKPEPAAVMKEMNKDICKKLKLRKTDKILEVGCGCGLQAIMGLKDKVSHYAGVDYSCNMIKKAKQFLQDCSFYVAEAIRLPFKANTFERILCHSVFPLFPDFAYAQKAISEFIRVCKPGGLILISDITSTENEERARRAWPYYIFKRLHFYKWLLYQTIFNISELTKQKRNAKKRFSPMFPRIRELWYPYDVFLKFQKTDVCTVEILKIPYPILDSYKRYTFDVRIRKL